MRYVMRSLSFSGVVEDLFCEEVELTRLSLLFDVVALSSQVLRRGTLVEARTSRS